MEQNTMLTWIIPVYNGEKYLAQAIDSILRQPCRDLAVLVIDDGSTDNSLKIAQGYDDPRVKAIHKENGGVSSARNLGIENAKSKYIAFLDADDVVCKGAYDDEIHDILAEEKYDLLSFSYYTGDQKLRLGNQRTEKAGAVECDAVKLDPFKHCSSFVYSKTLFDGAENIRFPEGIRIREDVSFQFLIYRSAENMLGINKNWFIYRNNVTSVLHRNKGPEYLIRDVVPAWHWCKSKCSDEKARNQCDILLFAEAATYIELACKAGVPVEKIRKNMENPEIRESMRNYDILWNGRKAIYEAFTAAPQKYWWRQRMKGVFEAPIHFAARLPGIRSLYMNLKYKENIEHLV